jgi:hypothetical protein
VRRHSIEELDGPAVSAIAEVVQLSQISVMGLVTYLLFRASPCFARNVKPLVPAALLSLARTNPHWARMVGYESFFLCVIHKEHLYSSSGDINRLMMIITSHDKYFILSNYKRQLLYIC